ncbi:hypothetical protein GCM10009096_27950 [Parasphingorhabdus litoris]|uniref:Uncharacterized protein n=1 Tax=Parasphingorhabdus litoris TaxID=394733 RepID=A0ABN1AU01_9SPHN
MARLFPYGLKQEWMIAGFGKFEEALNLRKRVGQITRLASETACFVMGKMTTMVISKACHLTHASLCYGDA